MIVLPPSLRMLVERFDPSGFDAPGGEVRIRLVVTEESEWDVLAGANGLRVVAADRSPIPDATVSADPETWGRIAADLRGGMEAYQAGRLLVRHNLHLGVGF